MTTTIIIIVVVLLAIMGGGAALWFFWQRAKAARTTSPAKESEKPAEKVAPEQRTSFRWSYVMLPLVVFVASIILTAVFYPRLPSEVAVRFASDGSPEKWLSREISAVLALLPQFIITLLAGGIVWGVMKSRVLSPRGGISWIEPQKILFYIGNMGALLQLVILDVMLQIFIYNVYQIQIMSVWVFAVIIMAIGGIFLGVFFIQAMMKAIRA